MAMSIIAHTINTVSFLVFVATGTAGLHERVDITPVGIEVAVDSDLSFAVGNIAYYRDEQARLHERGHLLHEDELGTSIYAPLAFATSVVGNALGFAGLITVEQYDALWTERRANELGGLVPHRHLLSRELR